MPRLSLSAVLSATLLLCVIATLVVNAEEESDDYYDILGLSDARDDAAERDIKSAWRKLSKKYHPDLRGESSREKYQKIQRAYEVLGDRKKRKVYDIKGEEGVKQLESPNQGQQGGMDPFMKMFGFGGGGGESKGANRGSDLHLALIVTLEDTYNGAAHSVKLRKTKICKACRGTGAASKGDMVTCPTCRGTGQTRQRVQIAPMFTQEVMAACNKCGGKGKIIKKKCPACKGQKIVNGEQTLGVDVEAGTPENFELVYDMEADQKPDELPGDVIFMVQTAKHDTFTRNGNDLEMNVKLTLSEALLGFTKTFKHLDDREVEFSEEGITQYQMRRKLEGEGMPVHHVPSEKGDLYITYLVDLPTHLTSEQKEAIKDKF